MATLREMTNAVLDASDRSISASRSAVNSQVNAAYFEVVRAGKTTLTTAALDLVAGQGDYSLSDLPFLGIKYLAFTDNDMTIYAQPTSLDEIIALRGVSQIVNAQTPYLFALSGFDFLSIYPTPVSTTDATLYYFYRPDPLGSDTDTPPDYILPQEFHDLIVLRALSQSVRTIAKGRNMNGAQMAQVYAGQYEAGLMKLRRHMNRAIGSRNASVQVGPPRRPRYANDIWFSGDNC